jgi:hypothetical protein
MSVILPASASSDCHMVDVGHDVGRSKRDWIGRQ